MNYMSKTTILCSILTICGYTYSQPPSITQQLLNILCCCCIPTHQSHKKTVFYSESDSSIPLRSHSPCSPQSPRPATPPLFKQNFHSEQPASISGTMSTSSSFEILELNHTELKKVG